MNNEKLTLIKKYIETNKAEIMKKYEEIVRLEGGTLEPENVNKVAEWVRNEFELAGFSCKIVDAKANGNSVVGILGEDRPGEPIIFSGHMDTVHPCGSFGVDPFKIVGDKLYGPGVLDMKGGIIIALFAIKALNSIGYNDTPLKIIFSGDEENRQLHSIGDQIIFEEAKGGLFAFNLETGRIDNALCIGRKGSIKAKLLTTGISCHAGNDFLSGRNAIEEMAHKVLKIQALTNLELETTVNVGVIRGGTISNAIPGECMIDLDVRYTKAEEGERIRTSLQEIADEVIIDKTSTQIEFARSFEMFETSSKVLDFYAYAEKTAKKYGLKDLKSVFLGGCSDAAYIALAGTPVLCAIGAVGQWNHTLDEYVLIDSIYERINLVSAMVLDNKEFKLSE